MGRGGVLKMYPTFKVSDTQTVVQILGKYGYTFPADEGTRPWAPQRRAAENSGDVEGQGPRASSSRSVQVGGSEGDEGGQRNRTPRKSQRVHVVRTIQEPVSQPALTRMRRRMRSPDDSESEDDTTMTIVSATNEVRRSKRLRLPGNVSTTKDGGVQEAADQRSKALRRLQRAQDTVHGDARTESYTGGTAGYSCDFEHSEQEALGPGVTVGGCAFNVAHREGEEDEDANFHVKPRHLLYNEDVDDREEGALPPQQLVEEREEERRSGFNLASVDCHPVPQISGTRREEVLREARREAALLGIQDIKDLRDAPEVVHAPGLYYLLSEGPVPVVEKEILTNHEECMERLRKMESDGQLSEKVIPALGHWIQWRLAKMVSETLFCI